MNKKQLVRRLSTLRLSFTGNTIGETHFEREIENLADFILDLIKKETKPSTASSKENKQIKNFYGDDIKNCKTFSGGHSNGKSTYVTNMKAILGLEKAIKEGVFNNPTPPKKITLPRVNNNFSSMEQYEWAKQVTDLLNK